ncbi:MAG: hypothetical protein WA956_02535 [Stenotrophomonas sp.]
MPLGPTRLPAKTCNPASKGRRTMNMTRWLPPVLAALLLAACGKGAEGQAPAMDEAGDKTADAGNPPPAQLAGGGDAGVAKVANVGGERLLMPPNWFPKDWDKGAYRGAEPGIQPDLRHKLQQELMLTEPFRLWAVANDQGIDEKFEPAWVWWAALRSCERGIQMSEDLGGEFGDRERGKASLTTARNELKAFAAAQPADITMYFTAKLGQWNAQTGRFGLGELGRAWNINALEVEKSVDELFPGGTSVQLYTDANGQALSELFAYGTSVQCVAADGGSYYQLGPQRNWKVVFGEIESGMGGLLYQKSRPILPAVNMTREEAAAFAGRNPERKVMVAVTFGPHSRGLSGTANVSQVWAALRKAEITDALDGVVLATRTY